MSRNKKHFSLFWNFFSLSLSWEKLYGSVLHYRKAKTKRFCWKRGADIFMLREEGEEKHQNILVKFSRDLHLHAVLLLNPWIIHFLTAKNAGKTRLFLLDSWLTRFSQCIFGVYLYSLLQIISNLHMHSKTFKNIKDRLRTDVVRSIIDYQRLSKTIEDHWRLSKTFEDYQRLLKTFEDFWSLSKTIEDYRR